MRHLTWTVLLLAAACGSDDATTGPDARTTTTMDVTCQPYVQTVQNADGSRTVTTYRYATIDAVGPDDDFTIESCGQTTTQTPPPPTCAAGSTCTGSITPPGVLCGRAHRTGTFVDGKLLVYCGYTIESFASGGAMTSSQATTYTSVKVSY